LTLLIAARNAVGRSANQQFHLTPASESPSGWPRPAQVNGERLARQPSKRRIRRRYHRLWRRFEGWDSLDFRMGRASVSCEGTAMMDSLPLEGVWWDPNNPGTQFPGRLGWDNGKIYLCLTVSNSREGLRPKRPESYEVIHGLTYTGKLVSLLDCFEVNCHGTHGVEQRRILANYVLTGGLVPKRSDVGGQFTEVSLEWPDLRRWFWHSGLSVEYCENRPGAFTIGYEPREPIEFGLSDGLRVSFRFGTDSIPVAGPLTDQVKFRDVVRVSLKPERPQNLDFFLKLIEEFKHFFSICLLEHTEPEETVLLGNFDVRDHNGHSFSPHLTLCRSKARRLGSDRMIHPINFLVPFEAVQGSLPEVIQRWHQLAAKTSPAALLYVSSLYKPNQYLEATFLSLVQSAEVFHRRYYGGTYLPQDQFEADVLPRLQAAIPGTLERRVRSPLVHRLSFLNEFSLAKRLKLMIQNHADVFDEYVPGTGGKIRGIVDARNRFTHYSSTSCDQTPKPRDLFLYIDILRMLVELEMMLAAGVERRTLHRCALKSQKYRWMFPPERRLS